MRKLSLLLLINIIIISSFSQDIKIKEPLLFLALGDSYTIGQSVPEADRWPVQLGERLKMLGVNVQEVEIRARTGWTTGNLLNSLDSDPVTINPNLVSLLIGVNNQYQGRSITEYAEEFEELLLRALNYVDNDPQYVFVVSIPDYAYTPFGGGAEYISEELDAFNDVNRGITSGYNVPYINITGISREGLAKPEYVASDGLHPSGLQYELWVDEILRYIPLTGSTVSNSDMTNESFEVYPNPFAEKLIINLDEEFKRGWLHITDINGKVILTQDIYPGETVIETEPLKKALYFMTIFGDKNKTRTIKILKK